MPLTPAELRGHIGAMFVSQLDAITDESVMTTLTTQTVIGWAVAYVRTGPGNLADRKEAMGFFLRRVYRAARQQDADLDPHTFRAHWIGDGGGDVT